LTLSDARFYFESGFHHDFNFDDINFDFDRRVDLCTLTLTNTLTTLTLISAAVWIYLRWLWGNLGALT
jgi:hypothetical protein